MVKELLLAIILGATLGFVVTGGALGLIKNKPVANKQITPTPTSITNTPSYVPASAITASPTPATSLLVTAPENESIVDTAKLTIQGSTTPSSIIIIKTEKSNYSGTSDTSGKFSIPVELSSGINNLQINSFDKNDLQQEVDLMVTFSTAKI